ncbi:protein C3orf33 homolog isoform X2 [Glandiceps talaboti]
MAPRRSVQTSLDEKSGENKDADALGISTIFRKSTNFIDDHISAVRSISTVLAVFGIGYIIKSIRPFKKFQHVQEIPKEFIRKNMRLSGKVTSVKDGQLNVEHVPIVDIATLPLIGSRLKRNRHGDLPVYLGGVELLDGADPFMKLHVDKRPVWFTILSVNKDGGIDCIVTLNKGWLRRMNVNETIIREGLGKATHIEGLTKNETYLKISQRLIKAEMYAEKKGKGIWIKPSRWERSKESMQLTAIKASNRVQSTTKQLLMYAWKRLTGVFRKKDDNR